MISIQYQNYLINDSYSYSGKTIYFHVWKIDDEGRPYDVWGDKFRSIKQAKNFIERENNAYISY